MDPAELVIGGIYEYRDGINIIQVRYKAFGSVFSWYVFETVGTGDTRQIVLAASDIKKHIFPVTVDQP